MQQLIMPKTIKERLNDMEIGGNIPLKDESEHLSFNSVMTRDFHRKDKSTGLPVSDKQFSVRTDKTTGQKVLWRLK